jgi:hypothetical protein
VQTTLLYHFPVKSCAVDSPPPKKSAFIDTVKIDISGSVGRNYILLYSWKFKIIGENVYDLNITNM